LLPSPVFLYHLSEQTVCIPIRLQTVKRIRDTPIPIARFLLNKMRINQKSIAEPTPDMIIFFNWVDESGQNGYPIGYYEVLGYGAYAY